MSKSARSAKPAPRSSVKSPITKVDLARVHGAIAKKNGGGVPKGSYVGRMQRIVAKTVK